MRFITSPLRFILYLAIAAAATMGLYVLDQKRTNAQQSDSALRLARQVAVQAEGLFFAGRQRGESDPLGWAVSILTQGAEPRAVRVYRAHEEKGGPAENYLYDSVSGIFTYSKVLSVEDGSAVKLSVATPHLQFLGATSRTENDLAIFSVFFAVFTVLALGSRATRSSPHRLRKSLQGWVAEAKPLLLALGANVRDVVRDAQQLAVASAQSRELVSQLRQRLHAGIDGAREAEVILKKTSEAIAQSEVAALNAAAQAAHLGANGNALSGALRELHQSLKSAQKLQDGVQEQLRKLQLQIEPCATDADMAFHSFDRVSETTRKLDGDITKTTESLMAQAKTLQNVGPKKKRSG